MAEFVHYTQMDEMDCGPTCLRMIAKHYGLSLTLQSLRDKSQINRGGVSMLGIANAAEEIGFKTLGVNVTLEQLVNDAPLPCIVHWDQNHFVIVYDIKREGNFKKKIKNILTNILKVKDNNFSEKSKIETSKGEFKKTVCVADPARGLVEYSLEEFRLHWITSKTQDLTGIALLLEPTQLIQDQDQDTQSSNYGINYLLGYLKTHKSLINQLFISLLVSSCFQLVLPLLTQSIVDVGISTRNISFIYIILAAQLSLTIGRIVVEFVRSWILLYISTRINVSVLSDFLIKLFKLPVSFFDAKQFGDLMQRINDHHRVEALLTSQTVSTIFSLINLLIFGSILLLYNTTIFFTFVAGTILHFVWVSFFLSSRKALDSKRFEALAKNQGALMQIIQGMQDIKLAGAERPMRWAWESIQVRLFKLQMKGLSLGQYQQAGATTINELKNVMITFLGAKAVIQGQLTLGSMLALQYIVGELNSPVDQLIGLMQNFQDAKISFERLSEIHSLPNEENSDTAAKASISDTYYTPLNEKKYSSITLKNVDFFYPGAGNSLVLNKINLTIPEGKTTAIVGMSGSGKTSLLKLLIRFYEPSSGEILVGNSQLCSTSHSMWRLQCGVVMQEGYIFSDTIARNISIGTENIDFDLLFRAIKVANLQDFINSLPAGYNTKIGARGNGISQGQRQRILIARAVYKNPKYIFFDEATNALDANNEAEIVKQLDDFFVDRTVVVVAHRLSTVKHADQIIVLDKGSIVEMGTHDALVEKQGAYWKLVKNQLELGA